MSEQANTSGVSCTLPGCSLGSVVAFALSWKTWHSLGWAVLHAIFGWFYVLYWIVGNL